VPSRFAYQFGERTPHFCCVIRPVFQTYFSAIAAGKYESPEIFFPALIADTLEASADVRGAQGE
jgi:hypothetical protein